MRSRGPAASVLVLAGLAGCGARGTDRDRAPPSPAPPAPPAAASPPAMLAPAPVPPPPAPPPTPSTCRAPFVVAPRYPDSFVDQAAASPAAPMGAWPTRPMRGPLADRELVAPGCTDVAALAAAPPFATIVHCATGDPTRPPGPGNLAVHLLVVRTARGWWSFELVRDYWPHGDPDDEPKLADVRDLAAADRLGDGGAELTAIAEWGPPGGAKTRRALVCGVGPSGTPACLDQRVAAGDFHRAGALAYRLELGCDGALALAGWEGGSPVTLVHGRGTLAFP